MDKKIIVIGGTAAGMTFASKLSRYKEKVNHVVYEKRGYTSLGACGIPFYVEGATNNSKDLISISNEEHISHGINLKVKHEVISVDLKNKSVMVKNLESGAEFEDKYEQLFIGTGAHPFIPPFPGRNLKNVFTATIYEDALALRKMADDESIKNIVIIGAGFIGLELTEALLAHKKKIKIIEMQELPAMAIFDKNIAEEIVIKLKKEGVDFHGQEMMKEVTGENKVKSVITDKGEYSADAVIVAIGFRPTTAIFKDQLEMYPNGSIKINQKGQTSIKDVWAAGDCVSIYNPVIKKDQYIPLATTSRKMATVIYTNMIEKKELDFVGSTGTSGFRFIDKDFFRTGVTIKQARDNGINCLSKIITAGDAAGYSGVKQEIKLKLTADDNKVIIGAQAVGAYKSGAIRIAALTTAITNKMTLDQIEQLDLFYTPPYSSTTDIIHIAARVLGKMIDAKMAKKNK